MKKFDPNPPPDAEFSGQDEFGVRNSEKSGKRPEKSGKVRKASEKSERSPENSGKIRKNIKTGLVEFTSPEGDS